MWYFRTEKIINHCRKEVGGFLQSELDRIGAQGQAETIYPYRGEKYTFFRDLKIRIKSTNKLDFFITTY
jgi:hypothetical protein